MSNLSDDFPITMEREMNINGEQMPPIGVAFGLYPMKNSHKSEKAGHDVFEDVEHVKIVIPGDRNNQFFQPASEQHKKRFPLAYKRFKEANQEATEGMPIEQWAPITRSVALTLKAANIGTVEALAAVHDGHIDKIGHNARELRTKAIAWLAQAKDSAAVMAVASDKDKLQKQIQDLQDQIARLGGKPVEKANGVEGGALVDPKVAVQVADTAEGARKSKKKAA